MRLHASARCRRHAEKSDANEQRDALSEPHFTPSGAVLVNGGRFVSPSVPLRASIGVAGHAGVTKVP